MSAGLQRNRPCTLIITLHGEGTRPNGLEFLLISNTCVISCSRQGQGLHTCHYKNAYDKDFVCYSVCTKHLVLLQPCLFHQLYDVRLDRLITSILIANPGLIGLIAALEARHGRNDGYACVTVGRHVDTARSMMMVVMNAVELYITIRIKDSRSSRSSTP
jgi:hypothetical protein